MKCKPRKENGIVTGYYIWCQGCKCAHFFPVENGKQGQKVWGFNGNTERPTFTPSLRHYYNRPASHEEAGIGKAGQEVTTCHIIVTDGKIQFCSDCPFEQKGQTLELEEIPADYGLPDDT